MSEERILTLHPQGKQGARIPRARYDAMRQALLAVLDTAPDDGVAFKDLADRVRPHLPSDVFAGASVTWHLTTVKLDLEARGEVERIPGARPQRLRRSRTQDAG